MHKTQMLVPVDNRPQAVIVASLRQDRRLATFCTLAVEQPDVARANLPADIRAALPALVEDAADQCQPLDTDAMTAALTESLALNGGGMSQSDRSAWILAMTAALQDVPADLAMEAIQHARLRCSYAAQTLPTITEYLEDYPRRRKARLKRLIALADAAGVHID
jgi:hypothetical protein